jgi:hypothetical protein
VFRNGQAGQTRPKAAEKYPVPVTKKKVQGFLGFTEYYRRIAVALTDLTRKSMPDKVRWIPISN